MPASTRRTIQALCVSAALLGLAGCETPTTARYAVSPDNVASLRHIGVAAVAVGPIAEPARYDVACRMEGKLKAPDGLTHAQYIRHALADELKVADAYADRSPRVTVTGAVTALNVGSMHGLTNGVWDIALHLASSNGHAMDVTEHYRFRSGFAADAACRNTAQAFLPAVQDLIHLVVTSPEFPGMVS